MRLNPAFLPKVPTVENLNRHVELNAFYPQARTHEEKRLHLLCPVRALRWYLQKTQGIREERQLLVSFQPGKLGSKVSAVTVAHWIREAICGAYTQLGREIPRQDVKAHSARAIAMFLADIRRVFPAELCAAATWSSALVFAKHYRLDMAARKGIATQVLSAAVAAGRP